MLVCKVNLYPILCINKCWTCLFLISLALSRYFCNNLQEEPSRKRDQGPECHLKLLFRPICLGCPHKNISRILNDLWFQLFNVDAPVSYRDVAENTYSEFLKLHSFILSQLLPEIPPNISYRFFPKIWRKATLRVWRDLDWYNSRWENHFSTSVAEDYRNLKRLNLVYWRNFFQFAFFKEHFQTWKLHFQSSWSLLLCNDRFPLLTFL